MYNEDQDNLSLTNSEYCKGSNDILIGCNQEEVSLLVLCL